MKAGKTTGSLLLILLISIYGCYYTTLKKEDSYPEEALKAVHFFPPTFRDDMDFASLETAVRNNLVYLDRVDPKAIFQYGHDRFTSRQIRESQKLFLKIISESRDWSQLNRRIRKRFRIYRATGRRGHGKVLFTGYFEPVFEASLVPDETFRYPLYRKPPDLTRIDLSLFNKKFKNETIIARIDGNRVLPYYTRSQIDRQKVLAGRGLEIAWLRDPVDVAFLQIQGSGRLLLRDGRTICVGYEASNGQPYRSIGRYMLDKGFLNNEEMSMQSIRAYLQNHPEIAGDVLACNPSYVFFHIQQEGPLGNIGVPLVPGRSLALDARIFPKGALAFVLCEKPDVDETGRIVGWRRFSRFVMNQDTGGAIKGAGRADLFWGFGPYAEIAAGHMNHEGELYFLVKKDE
ncbi:MAG: murein transglycosylase [Deltaproteobacteria bacterium]|nr:MAG: hypothetical protein B5M55_04700 [Desulfococcus sp. 4484_242]RLC31651.1 MAG: murein transglycosylase [Deltaproteobacteria bacterium]